MRRFGSLVCLLVLIAAPTRAQKQAHVTGTVTDTTSAPVSYASVQVAGTFMGAAADEEGHYAISLPPGTHVLRFRALGYQTEERTVTLEAGETVRLDVTLVPKQLQLGQVTVEAERARSAPSTYRLSARSIKNAPALGIPDVVRAAALLPGVTQANDLKASLNVRGGASDQNLFLLDGVPVYQPTHLFGIFSAFNLWALRDVTFYAGTFPVRYGGRLSSVMALRTKTPRDSSMTKAHLSLISANVAATRQWGNTFVLVAARRAYLDLVLAAAGTDGSYNFYDANLKVVHDLSGGWALEAMGFLSRDAATAYATGRYADVDSLRSRTHWGNYLGALRLRYDGARSSHRLTGSVTQRFSRNDYPGGNDHVRTRFTDLALRYNGAVTFSKNRFRFGLNYRQLRLNYGWQAQGGLELETLFYEGLPLIFDAKDRAPMYSAYFSAERLLTSRLRLRGGLRYSNLGALGGGVLSPRLDASYRVSEAVTLTAGAGRYAQFMAEGAEGIEFTVGEPLFLLRRPQHAWTYALGTITTFDGGAYRLSTETYYRSFSEIARLKGELGTPFPTFTFGEGTAFGLDVFLQKQRGWLTYQLSYSFLHARMDLGEGAYSPGWGVPHTVQGLLGLKLGHYWKFTLAGTFRSGLPYTPVVGKFIGPGTENANEFDLHYIPGERNSVRFPPYTRLDVALRRTYRSRWFTWTLSVQIMNLLNQGNELRLDPQRYYRYLPAGAERHGLATSLPIIPSVGVELTF